MATRLENFGTFWKFSISTKKNSAYEYYRQIVYLHGYDEALNNKDIVTSNKSFEQQLQVKAIMREQ